MAELPHMPLATDAYLGDTRHLTTLEHGAYLLLLMIAWRVRGRPCLPDDDKLLARYTGCDPRTWRRIKPTIMAFWNLGDDGQWTQKKQLEMRDLTNKRVEKMRNMAAAKWGPKPLENTNTDDATAYATKTKTSLTPIVPKGTKAEKGYGDESDPLFADFLSGVWSKRWERKGHNRFKAFGAYARLSDADRSELKSNIERCARAIVSERSEEKFRPMLQSWLNARGWEVDAADSSAPPAAVDWAGRVAYFRDHDEWPPAWGPRPGERDCHVPAKLLIAAA